MAFSRVGEKMFVKVLCHLPTRPVLNCGTNVRMFSKGFTPLKSNVWFLSLVGIGTGAVVGAGYSYLKSKEPQTPVLTIQKDLPTIKSIPKMEVSRKVVFENDSTGLRLKLFQYATCPFCCKVRAFLDYYGISYDVIEVNPVMRQQIRWSHYKKVPILVAENQDGCQQLNDSSMIISALMSYIIDKSESLTNIVNFYPTMLYKQDGYEKTEILNRYFLMCQEKNQDEKTKEAMTLERKWRQWVDDTFVHVLSPNVYRTRSEALETFNWFSEAGEWETHFPAWERKIVIYVGAYAMWLISKRLKKRHNLKDDVRQSFYDECNEWMKAVHKQGTPFLGGEQPNLADLAVYGVLNSIEGSRAFKDVLSHTKLGVWYWSVKAQVNKHKGNDTLKH
ncbi:hypothetical protein R5R35_012419 [Gryllus longicercus]|uniref:GST C-terminal domain-containing protein n=1 Tax=Gryllus longicercus TaxID=2509291 RepID=A0AAN9VPV6_9ORTH|nr:Prostaglandin E synthase 2 [Gryllus bimaculatus]